MLRNSRASSQNSQRIQERIYSQNSLIHHIRERWPAVIIGFIGLLSGMIVIVWNEARAVQITKSLDESISSVTQVVADGPVDSTNIGKPVYMTGPIMVQEPLTEVEYGVSVLAVKLKKRVQMYQWVEEELNHVNTNGDIIDTSYYYYMDWKDKLIDSSSFETTVGHWNPNEFPVKSQTQINEKVKIGNYEIGYELKNKFSNYVEITSDERPEHRDIKLHAGLYYHSQDVWNPEVGDLRIHFSYAGHHGEIVTVVGKLDNSNTLVPYKTKLGVNVLLLRSGYVSVEEIFAQEYAHNRFLLWLYRGGAWLLLYIGCICLTNVLGIIVYESRVLREMLPTSHSSIKMTVSMCLFLLVTALSWFWYRPVLGFGLVLATIFILFVTRNISHNRTSQNNYNR